MIKSLILNWASKWRKLVKPVNRYLCSIQTICLYCCWRGTIHCSHPEVTHWQLADSVGLLSLKETHRQRVVTRDQEDVEDGGGGEVAGQEAAGVGKDGLGVDDGQAEEGDGPNPVEDLE